MKKKLLQPESSEHSISRAQPLVLVFSVGTQQESLMCSSGNRSFHCVFNNRNINNTQNEKLELHPILSNRQTKIAKDVIRLANAIVV